MPITVEVSDEILKAIPAINKDAIPGLIELGAKQIRIEQALAIFKEGKISIWRASRIAGLPLRAWNEENSAAIDAWACCWLSTCKTGVQPDRMRKRYVQALYLSPGFGDFGRLV